jgi:hypothetical protein
MVSTISSIEARNTSGRDKKMSELLLIQKKLKKKKKQKALSFVRFKQAMSDKKLKA